MVVNFFQEILQTQNMKIFLKEFYRTVEKLILCTF
jgi:hypothetical protein